MQKIARHIVALFLLMILPTMASSDFCDERTTTAYHSPQCGQIWMIRDPRRVEQMHITHDPAYHTYSRWTFNNRTYVFAYRDVDNDPNDTIVDIYSEKKNSYKLIGNIDLPGYVIDVSTIKLTSRLMEDVLIRCGGGQLQYLSVIRFAGGRAKKVFEYGASVMEVTEGRMPMIVAKSESTNSVEVFGWNEKIKKFNRIRKYPWHEEKKK